MLTVRVKSGDCVEMFSQLFLKRGTRFREGTRKLFRLKNDLSIKSIT